MYGDDAHWAARFPALFRGDYVGYADCRVTFTTAAIPEHLVSRLHLVAVTPGAEVVVCRSEQGWRFLPGGTREPGESLHGLGGRELMEEAGALLLSDTRCFAAHVADSARQQPFRPHLPHPRAYWAYAVAGAQVVAAPTNPPDGEHVVEVLTLPLTLAADFIEKHDPVHADVLRLADAMGLVHSSG